MEITSAVKILGVAEQALCLTAFLLIAFRRQFRSFAFVAAFLAVRGISGIVFFELAYGRLHLSPRAMYPVYFYTYWSSYLLETLLGFGIILSIYRLAMAPLRGLQRLGMIMFRWAGGIAVLLALTVAIGPKVTGADFAQRVISQLQQTQSVLTLCMLLFVCLAARPMGLSYRSKTFGICFGLGILSTVDLLNAAWFTHLKSAFTLQSLLGSAASIACIVTWSAYFAFPDPKRRMIVLPTTSPFLRWNQISIALGDEPGYVAIGEVTPDMFAPAEVEIMRRATLKMKRLAN